MDVSVVVCTYSMEVFEDFVEATESVLDQTYDDVEVVVVVDGTPEVYDAATDRFAPASDDRLTIVANDENRGLLASRNRGARVADGDVVAFIDDDAVAEPDWIAELVEGYEQREAPAVGGRMAPLWVAGRPRFLPEEFFWLVGVTHRGYPEKECEVRNTFGSNISFRRDVFLDIDGFDTEIGGRKGSRNLQGGETELCARMRRRTGHGVWYRPSAVVGHKVFAYRTRFRWLLSRAFWQGYSKRAMEVLLPETGDEESAFLGDLLFRFLPSRLAGIVRSPSVDRLLQFVAVWVFTAAVGFGYLYGFKDWR